MALTERIVFPGIVIDTSPTVSNVQQAGVPSRQSFASRSPLDIYHQLMPFLLPFVLAASFQAQQPAPAIPESPIARIVVTPATFEVVAGDTVKFSAEARDAGGRKIDNAIIRFVARG